MSEQVTNQFSAGVDLIGRTGAEEFQLRISAAEEDAPDVFLCLARYRVADTWLVGAGLHPDAAIQALLDKVLDGGQCRHCGRITGAIHDLGPVLPGVCWYQYDPELKTYRRGCEGDTPPRTSPNPFTKAQS